MQTRDFRALPRRTGAFSLIELMTAVAIMLVIIFALYSMFSQTQKALRANITQVDVLESGRAAAEMLGRELEQLAASQFPRTTNLYVGMTPIPEVTLLDIDQDPRQAPLRTNIIQEFFFLTRQTNKWVGTGYRVLRANNGVGTLYRFTVATNYHALNYTNLMMPFQTAALRTNATTGQLSTNFNRVADGVIHLRVTAFDPDGRRLDAGGTNIFSTYRILRLDRSGRRLGLTSTADNIQDANVVLRPDPFDPRNQTQFAFLSNALPGYIEVELGVLEPTALRQLESMADSPKLADAYLRKQAGKVHLFRQRIPIRTALQ